MAVTGLTSGTTYYVAVYEYTGTVDTSGVNQGTNYKAAAATGSQLTNEVPTLTSPTATAVGSSTATLGANVTSDNGSAITARGTVWGTSANPTGNAVAEGGTATGLFTHARTGLTAGTKIYYRGYATTGSGTGYSPDGSFYTEPAAQASGVSFTSVGPTSMTVNWARGSGDGVIVLMRQGSAVATDPTDGVYTTYFANTAFGSGTAIGDAYVIYKGTGTGVTVTGLTIGTTYYVAVYEYTGTVDTASVDQQGTNYKPAAATGNQATSATGNSYSYTFNYTGSVQTVAIPAGATNIQFSIKGAGGGGGRADNVGNQQNGQSGHFVAASYFTSDVTVSVYVGGGGAAGSTTSSGAGGGWGYHTGGNGGNGDDDGHGICWAFGGAGGGGSSAILLGATVITESAGGAGGRSSDWDGTLDGEACYSYAGAGGAAGGSDYPSTGSSSGGTGGIGSAGGNGQVVISYD